MPLLFKPTEDFFAYTNTVNQQGVAPISLLMYFSDTRDTLLAHARLGRGMPWMHFIHESRCHLLDANFFNQLV
jgi:hypothetical protein